MARFVTRFNIQTIQNHVGKYWAGEDMGFVTDEEMAVEYYDQDEAEADAAACGGEVCEYQRYCPYSRADSHMTLGPVGGLELQEAAE